jgi:hypothetical protein
MKTLGEAFVEYLGIPDTAEFAKCFEAKLASFIQSVEEPLRAIRAEVTVVANSAPSPGFVRRDFDPIIARMMARLLVRRGWRIARESQRLTNMAEAIEFLATPGRSKMAARSRAKILIAAWEETSIIETLFDRHGLGSEGEFVELARSVADGEDGSAARLSEIAASIGGLLSRARGPKVGAATAAHQFLLESLPLLRCPEYSSGYTYSDVQGDYVDEMTQPTRLEFSNSDFSPQTARRRMRRPAEPEKGFA